MKPFFNEERSGKCPRYSHQCKGISGECGVKEVHMTGRDSVGGLEAVYYWI